MPNRYIENTVLIGLLFALGAGIRPLLRLFGNSSKTVENALLILLAVLLYLVFIRYRRIRNNRFVHKLYSLIYQNNYETAFALIRQTIKRQPKAFWLRIELAILSGLAGDVESFLKQKEELCAEEWFWKSGNRYSLLVLCDAINLLLGSKYLELYKSNREEATPDKHLGAFHWLFAMSQTYYEGEYDSAIKFAKEFVGLPKDFEPTKSDFFRLLTSFIMYRSYEALGDEEQSTRYRAEYHTNLLSVKFRCVD